MIGPLNIMVDSSYDPLGALGIYMWLRSVRDDIVDDILSVTILLILERMQLELMECERLAWLVMTLRAR
jgi:hypothetical protein